MCGSLYRNLEWQESRVFEAARGVCDLWTVMNCFEQLWTAKNMKEIIERNNREVWTAITYENSELSITLKKKMWDMYNCAFCLNKCEQLRIMNIYSSLLAVETIHTSCVCACECFSFKRSDMYVMSRRFRFQYIYIYTVCVHRSKWRPGSHFMFIPRLKRFMISVLIWFINIINIITSVRLTLVEENYVLIRLHISKQYMYIIRANVFIVGV